MSTFTSVLDKPSNTVERTPPLPGGTYLCVVNGLPRYDASAAKKTKFVEFTLIPRQAADDVNLDELAEAGGLEGKKLRHTIYYERANGEELDNAGADMREFATHCGIPDDGRSLRARLEETVNASLMVKVRHEADQDGKRMYARVAKTAPAE